MVLDGVGMKFEIIENEMLSKTGILTVIRWLSDNFGPKNDRGSWIINTPAHISLKHKYKFELHEDAFIFLMVWG